MLFFAGVACSACAARAACVARACAWLGCVVGLCRCGYLIGRQLMSSILIGYPTEHQQCRSNKDSDYLMDGAAV